MRSDAPLRRWPTLFPVFSMILVYLIALALRSLDIFVFRLDERWGEIILSKSLGLLLVLAYTYAVGQSVRAMGLHRQHLGKGLALAAGGMALIYAVGFTLQVAVLHLKGMQPRVAIAAIDPKTGMAGGALFALWLVLGNLVNALMEEGLFRGLMIRHFLRRFGSWQANGLQALLFAVWHVVWPIKHLMTGQTDWAGAVAEGVTLLAASAVSGYVFGYMYLKTSTLWAPICAHTINNTVLNLVHVGTAAGLDANMVVVQGVLLLGLIGLVPITRSLTRRWGIPAVRPWS